MYTEYTYKYIHIYVCFKFQTRTWVLLLVFLVLFFWHAFACPGTDSHRIYLIQTFQNPDRYLWSSMTLNTHTAINTCMYVIYGWMYGWMYVWMYVCMDAGIYGCTDVWMYRCMDVWVYERMDVLMDGCMDGCIYIEYGVFEFVYVWIICVYIHKDMYIYIYIWQTRICHPCPVLMRGFAFVINHGKQASPCIVIK